MEKLDLGDNQVICNFMYGIFDGLFVEIGKKGELLI
jgi:hypothetical protein